jgi:hypothetical protein
MIHLPGSNCPCASIIESERNPLYAAAALRRQTQLGLPEALEHVMTALDERYGVYYGVKSGSPDVRGPFIGLATATKQMADTELAPVVVVVGHYLGSVPAAVQRFLRALPDTTDIPVIDRLLRALYESAPLPYVQLGGSQSRRRLIIEARTPAQW